MDHRRAEFRRRLLRRHQRAPGRAPGKARRLAIAHARARDRPQPIGGEQRIAALMPDAAAALRRNGDAIVMGDEIFHPRAKPQLMSRFSATAALQRCLQIAAMDRPIGRAVALFGGVAERHAHDFAAALGVEHAQGLRRDHDAAATACQGRARSTCGSHWARAGCRRRSPRAARPVPARRRENRCGRAPAPRSVRRCRRRRR